MAIATHISGNPGLPGVDGYLRSDSRYFVCLRGGFCMLSGQFVLALLRAGLLFVGPARQAQPVFWVTESAILYLDKARNRDDFETALHAEIAQVEEKFKEARLSAVTPPF